MFEEELAGRKAFWRRAQQLQEEAASTEGRISRLMLAGGDSSARAGSVNKELASLQDSVRGLTQLTNSEIQRRHDNKAELANRIPPDVLQILFLVDSQEGAEGKTSLLAHARFAEVVGKLLGRVTAEEEQYQERLRELRVSV